ncbi:helix-turn-helix domain-containing protein [Spirosoma fluminis]
MDKLKVVGTNIAYLRDALGLSQQQLAEYLGVNRVEISYFENGQRPVPNSKLIKLADLAGINAEDLLDTRFNQQTLKVKFAFRSDGFEPSDLQTIAEFQRIARTYLRFKLLSGQKEV